MSPLETQLLLSPVYVAIVAAAVAARRCRRGRRWRGSGQPDVERDLQRALLRRRLGS